MAGERTLIVPTRLHLTLAGPHALGEGPGAGEHQLEVKTTFAAEQGQAFWRLDGQRSGLADWARLGSGLYSILLEGRSFEVRVSRLPGAGQNQRDTPEYRVRVGSESFRVTVSDPRSRRQASGTAASAGSREIMAPMPGKIVKLLVQEGDEVTAGQGLLVMEAMKMQNEMRAPRAGRVERIYAVENGGVETGAPLLRLA